MVNVLHRTLIEAKIGERFYRLECSPDSPLTELAQALVLFHNAINERIKAEQEKAEQANPQPEVV